MSAGLALIPGGVPSNGLKLLNERSKYFEREYVEGVLTFPIWQPLHVNLQVHSRLYQSYTGIHWNWTT